MELLKTISGNMLRFIYITVLMLGLCACEKQKEVSCGLCGLNMNRVETPESPEEALAMQESEEIQIEGDQEFKENKVIIEKKYGEQWDFCKCIVLNDSIDRQVKAGNITDPLMARMEQVDLHCKAFLVMDENKTPDERDQHEKKVKMCLKAAGIGN